MERVSGAWRKKAPHEEGLFCSWGWLISKGRSLRLGIWSLEEKAGKEPMQEKDSGAKDLPGIGVPSWTSRRRSRAGERRFRSSKESLARRSVGEGFWFCVLMFRCSKDCQRPESMLLYGVGYLGLSGLRLLRGPWSVQGCLLKLRTWKKSIWWTFFPS